MIARRISTVIINGSGKRLLRTQAPKSTLAARAVREEVDDEAVFRPNGSVPEMETSVVVPAGMVRKSPAAEAKRIRPKTVPAPETPYMSHISARGQRVIDSVAPLNIKYDRGGNAGEGLLTVPQIVDVLQNEEGYPEYYSEADLAELLESSAAVQDRMRIKVSMQYMDHALRVPENANKYHPILDIVLPQSEEVDDVAGEADPSNQNRYSPIDGLLHKYEMLLGYMSINCSSHCRYCYRSDLFNGVSDKSRANIDQIALYTRRYNALVEDAISTDGHRDPESGLMVHRETGDSLLPIREILFSGGDPLTLPNTSLLRYMILMAESGIRTIRFGTKEFIFNPARFDDAFFGTLDAFHEAYPEARVELIGHYSHPFELLNAKTDEDGEYLYDIDAEYEVRPDIKKPLDEINARRTWLGHFNQFPIIADVNDRADILRLIMYASNRLGITIHNVYACREIIGNKHFRKDNDIAHQYNLLQRAKVGLSGIENHARLIMSTEYGKMEVIDIDEDFATMRLNRFVHANKISSSTVRLDLSKLEDGKFYWVTNEHIEGPALTPASRALFEELERNDQGFIRQIKDQAAAYCQQIGAATAAAATATSESAAESKVDISIVNSTSASQVTVDLADERDGVTLADVLHRYGAVEAACKCSLSCSTCVGFVDSDQPMDGKTLDEDDIIDMMDASDEELDQMRATCCLKLRGGESYSFRAF